MALKIQCPNPACAREGNISREQVGKDVCCPGCQTTFRALPSVDRSGTVDYPVAQPFAPPPDPHAVVAQPAPNEERLPRQIGRFQIRQWLGRGGFGDVYRAYDPQLEREVALKVPKADTLDRPVRVERFLREARSAARLRHPHIVPVYESGQDGGCYYIAAAFIEGQTLASAIDEGAFDCQRAASIARHLADALAYAHELGIIHRDVKPANVMLDDKGQPHLVDFGLAYRLGDRPPHEAAAAPSPDQDTDGRLTSDRGILGTPAYMAPEQAAGRQDDVQAASDQYSLGVLLYELLCGRTPFSGPPQIILFNAIHSAPVPPREARPDIAPDLEAICLKTLAKQPADRYPSCRALAEDLRRYAEGEETHARPWRARERWLRWCRREPARARAVGLAAAALVALFVLTVVFAIHQSWAARRIGEEKETAEKYGKQAQANADRAEKYGKQAEGNADKAEKNAKEARTKERDAKRLSAGFALDQGQMWCEQGETGKGMLWLARGLDLATLAQDADLQEAIRFNLAAWRRRAHPLRMCLRLGEPLFALAWGPDGRSVLVGQQSGVARLDLLTGREIGKPLLDPGGPVHALALTMDGKAVLTGTEDGQVHFWDLEAGTKRTTMAQRHAGGVTCVALSPDGQLAASGGADGTVRLWHLESGRQLRCLQAHTAAVRGVAFSPCGKALLTGGSDGAALLWELDSDTGRDDARPARSLRRGAGAVTAVAYDPAGKTVLLARGAQLNGEAQLWSVGGELLTTLAHQAEVQAVAFSPSGTVVLSAGQDRSARMWVSETGTPLGRILWHPSQVLLTAFSPNGRFVLTGDGDRTIRLWEVAQDGALAEGAQRPVTAVAILPGGRALLAKVGLLDGTTQILDGATGQPLGPPLQAKGHISAMALSADGKTLLTGAMVGTKETVRHVVQTWDLATGAEQKSWLAVHEQLIFRAAFSPDGQTVATASFDGTVRVRGLADGRKGLVLRHEGEARVYALAFSPDSRHVMTGGTDRYARVWDAATGNQVAALRHPDAVLAGVFSARGQALLTGYAGAAQLWRKDQAGHWEKDGPPLQHAAGVLGVAIGPDGRLLATAGTDRAARLWHGATRKPIGPPFFCDAPVLAVAFAADGRTLVTGAFDKGIPEGSIRRWEVPHPATGEVQELDLWVRRLTGIRLGEQGDYQVLEAGAWAGLPSRQAGTPEAGWEEGLRAPAMKPPSVTPYLTGRPAAALDWVAYVPDDTELVAHLDVRQVLGSDLVKGQGDVAGRALTLLGTLPGGELLRKQLPAMGLDPVRDLDSFTFVATGGKEVVQGAVIVRGRFDRDKLQAAAVEIGKGLGGPIKVARDGRHLVLEIPVPQQGNVFVTLVERDTLLLSSTREGLTKVLARADAPRKPALGRDLEDFLTTPGKGQSLRVAATGKALATLTPELQGVTGLRATVSVEQDVKLHVTLGTSDAQKTKALAAKLNEYLKAARAAVAAPGKDEWLILARDFLREVRISEDAQGVTLRAVISGKVAEKVLKHIFP